MDRSLKQASTAAFLAAGCVFSASSHAYSAAEDAAVQDQEVKAAYDRGYQAAKQELARQAAEKASAAAANTTTPAATTTAQKTTTPPRKPILDIKNTYSDAGHVETVQQVPVTATPLPEQTAAQTPPPAQARVAPQAPAHGAVAVAADAAAEPKAPADQQAARSANPNVQTQAQAQAQDDDNVVPTRRAMQQRVAQPEETADDEGADDAAPAGTAQQYADQTPRYAQPQAQYAPPPVAARQVPQPPQQYGYAQQPAYAPAQQDGYAQQQPAYAPAQPYGYVRQPAYAPAQQYGYVQQPAYQAPRPYAYYAPPAPSTSRHRRADGTGRRSMGAGSTIDASNAGASPPPAGACRRHFRVAREPRLSFDSTRCREHHHERSGT